MFSFFMWNYKELGAALQPTKAVPNVAVYYNSVHVSRLSIDFGQHFLVWVGTDILVGLGRLIFFASSKGA